MVGMNDQQSTAPRAFLVPREHQAHDRTWSQPLPTEGLWKVTGQAGSGVTSFLIDTFVASAKRQSDAEGVLFLTDSKESAARIRAEISERLADTDFVADGPMVRSVHSLAFAVLREQQEQLRLISGAEQDAVIRQLLQGHVEDGRGSWPAELRPALPMVGFARQLRDFLLRAIERGLDAEQLKVLGARYGQGIWSAAGDFLEEYQQVMALTGTVRYSASELIARALDVPLGRTWHTVIVDDAQHLSPAAAKFVQRLLQGAALGVVGGDLEQSVYQFRGASPEFFATLGGLEHTVIDLGQTRREPEVSVALAQTPTAQLAAVADALRRAHLEEEVAFRDMAVIVRSSGMIEPFRRALLHAGVPVALNPTDVVLSEQRIVASLLLGLQSLYTPLTVEQWRDLLLGPIGGTDPVTLRRLLRGLRRWKPEARAEETLRDLVVSKAELPDFGEVLTDRELQMLHRIRQVLDAAREVYDADGSVEEVLWALWNATGLADHLTAVALRGGTTGSQADRDLDAVMALFDAAGDFTERKTQGGLELFVNSMLEQELPTGVRDRRAATPDAVALLTAHGAVGRQFSRVVVAGVQDLEWPSLGETGSIFGQQDLVDLVDHDVDPATPVSHLRERLEEERRLFHVALTRATERVLVTAVDQTDGEEVIEPSRFVEELCEETGISPQLVTLSAEDAVAGDDGAEATVVRVLSRDDFLGELRRTLADEEHSTEADRRQAARQIARLVEAGVPLADPEQWWTTTEPSTNEPVEGQRSLSPSRIEALLKCPMSSVLERTLGFDSSMPMVIGSIVHAYFEALGRGVPEEQARMHTLATYRAIVDAPAWQAEAQVRDFEAMLERTNKWWENRAKKFEVVGMEVPISVQVAEDVHIRGRADRLDKEESGSVHIVDLKTGSTMLSVDSAKECEQLMAYQLALSHGQLIGEGDDLRVVTSTDGQEGLDVGGAALVYSKHGTNAATTREQPRKEEEELEYFTELIAPLPGKTTGPQLEAQAGKHCDYCAVRALCPVQIEGTMIYNG